MRKMFLPIMKKIMMLIIFIVMVSISCHRDKADDWIYSVPLTVNDGWQTILGHMCCGSSGKSIYNLSLL